MGIGEKTSDQKLSADRQRHQRVGGKSDYYFPVKNAFQKFRRPKTIHSWVNRELGPAERVPQQAGPFKYKYRTIVAIDKDIAYAPPELRATLPRNARPPVVAGVDVGPEPGLNTERNTEDMTPEHLRGILYFFYCS